MEPRTTISPGSPRGTSLVVLSGFSGSTIRTSTSSMARPDVVEIVSGSSSWRHMVAMPDDSVSP